jgi:acyl-CoA thioesterase-2
MPGQAEAVDVSARPGLLDLLTLERVEVNLFLTTVTHDDPRGLYGGQVAAQALRAAAATVDPDRRPHSLHGYFLSRGDASRRVLLTVNRDRDGRSYSNRRVIAVQEGTVIFNMAASFHRAEEGPSYQAHTMPDVAPPDDLPALDTRASMYGIDIRVPGQPRGDQGWPSRVWIRTQERMPDDILHACAQTYVSDMFSGLSIVPGLTRTGPPTSIDHAVWFYRRIPLDDWALMDLQPESIADGRGTYTGRIFGRDGTLGAGIAQESVYRVTRQDGPGQKGP